MVYNSPRGKACYTGGASTTAVFFDVLPKTSTATCKLDDLNVKHKNRYFRCKDLDALFVHAGFTPGVSMRRQNPRMMMNMRSLTIEAGAPTSKVVENRPWAR